MQALAEDLLFHQGLAESHVHAALDLALDQERIDRAPDVVRDPDLVDADQPGACVGVEVDHAGRIAVGGTGADARTLVGAGDLRRGVAAGGR